MTLLRSFENYGANENFFYETEKYDHTHMSITYIFLTLMMVPGTRAMFSVVVLKLISSPLSNQIVAGGLL